MKTIRRVGSRLQQRTNAPDNVAPIHHWRTAAWCDTHNDLAWVYDDGSVECMYQLVVESHDESCRPQPLNIAQGWKPGIQGRAARARDRSSSGE